MSFQVNLTTRATSDIESALEWLQETAPHALEQWYEKLMAAIHSLEYLPTRYPVFRQAEKRLKLDFEVREMLFGKRRGTFRVFYRIIDDTVNVLHIRRASRGPLNANDLRL